MAATGPSWRRVDLDGVGAVEVRPVTLRDTVGVDVNDPSWFHVVVRHADGRPFTKDDVLDLPLEAANTLAQEVIRPRPTQPPTGGFGG